MKTQGKWTSRRVGAHRIAVIFSILAVSVPTFAALGDTALSVQADQLKIKASLKLVEADAYTIHEMQSPTGTVIREYVSRSNRLVFAVTWQGPFIPDMKQLLGNYFPRYSQAVKAQHENRIGVNPLEISEPALVVQTAGHMRAFSGRAYDPGLVPPGVSVDDIR
jgi:hypothetical protein